MYIQNDPLSIQYNNIAVLLYLEGNSDQSLYLYDGVTKTHRKHREEWFDIKLPRQQ